MLFEEGERGDERAITEFIIGVNDDNCGLFLTILVIIVDD